MIATMARVFGRNTGLWAVGLLGVVTVGPLAVLSPDAAALTVAAAGCLGVGTALSRVSGLNARSEKLSQEIDVLSQRLLRAERPAPTDVPPSPQTEALRAEVHELTVEIGLLSGIVRDLSAVIRSQDDEIAALKASNAAAKAAEDAPRPSPAAAPIPALPPSPAFAPAPAERVWTPPPVSEIPEAAEPDLIVPAPPLPPRPIPPRPPEAIRGPDDAAIVAAFDGERLDVYLQPVVTLPQRKVVGYEAFARLRIDDQPLDAAQYLPALERHGRTTELDRRMLARTGTIVRHLARRGSEARVTYGLSPLSLFEPGFLKEIARTTGDDQALAGLEIALPQASWRGLDSGQRGLLAALRGRVGFCLDRPTDLRFDARELAALGIGQVKVPAGLMRHPAGAGGALSDIAVEDLAPALARARIRLVVTDVATDTEVPDLLDLNVPFAQGTAFSPARPVRGEILAALPPEVPQPQPPADGPSPERRSFRSLLRRAG